MGLIDFIPIENLVAWIFLGILCIIGLISIQILLQIFILLKIRINSKKQKEILNNKKKKRSGTIRP